MKEKIIPDSDHVARYCKPSTIDGDEIQATAFFLRPEEPDLSVNWLEFFKLKSREKEISEIQKIYSRKFKKVSSNARIAVLNVGETKIKVLESEDKRNLKFKHNPLQEDPSHSSIYDMRPNAEEIAELILSVVDHKNHVYPAK